MFVIMFGLTLGVFNALGTAVDEIADAFDIKEMSAFIGAGFIIGGIVGSAIYGILLDKYHKFKLTLIIIQITSIFAVVLFTLVLMFQSKVWSAVVAFILGALMIPIWPVGVEYVAEITFPVEEDMSTGMIMTAGQLVGIFHVLIISILNDKLDSPKTACTISLWIMNACIALGLILVFFLKEDLR